MSQTKILCILHYLNLKSCLNKKKVIKRDKTLSIFVDLTYKCEESPIEKVIEYM